MIFQKSAKGQDLLSDTFSPVSGMGSFSGQRCQPVVETREVGVEGVDARESPRSAAVDGARDLATLETQVG